MSQKISKQKSSYLPHMGIVFDPFVNEMNTLFSHSSSNRLFSSQKKFNFTAELIRLSVLRVALSLGKKKFI